MLEQLSNYIATEILKQPSRVIQPDEALISSGLIDSFSLFVRCAGYFGYQFAHLGDAINDFGKRFGCFIGQVTSNFNF